MLSLVRAGLPTEDTIHFADLRAREFGILDEQGLTYLDYTGAALPMRSQLDAQESIVRRGVWGNPHSLHPASRRSTDAIDVARARVLAFVDADPDEYGVCFTANSSAAIKLVAEGFQYGGRGSVVVSADNHNSVNGIREYAARAGARVTTIALDRDLRLRDPSRLLGNGHDPGSSLLAYPAQSNFSGVQHSLALVDEARRRGYSVLLDAAAFVPSNALSLRRVPADFVVMSMYKMFGFPAGVGALIARHEALRRLRRPWFAGGTVDWVSVSSSSHRLKPGVEGFEDGTPNFAGIAAIPAGLDALERIGMSRLTQHVHGLTRELLRQLCSRRHASGSPVFLVYGPADNHSRGGTVAFNLLNVSGAVVDYEHVEARAAQAGVAIRGGCFCNPGAAEKALSLSTSAMRRCFESTASVPFLPRLLATCLGEGTAVGALRASVGAANTVEDVQRAVDVIAAIAGA